MAFITGELPLKAKFLEPRDEKLRIIDAVRSLGFLNLETGPWVAGGAVRRILTNENCGGDIDVFLPISGPWSGNRAAASIAARWDTACVKDDLNAITFGINNYLAALQRQVAMGRAMISPLHPDYEAYCLKQAKPTTEHVLHVIQTNKFDTVEDLLNDFDFTICMAATDGWNWIADERFFEDVVAKRLVLNNATLRPNRHGRLMKYCQYGYTPVPGVLERFLAVTEAGIPGLAKDGHLDPLARAFASNGSV